MEIAISAGEVSGDIQAARLISAIKEISPGTHLWGMGGENMRGGGTEILYDITQWAVVGFWEVAKNYNIIRNVFYGMVDAIKKRRPDAVVLVDYPGFNLRLAGKIKSFGIPVIYYIGPQVWAWGRGRIKYIKSSVDKMIVIFPFEKEFYENEGIPAEFVGHPIIDILETRISRRKEFRDELGIKEGQKLIGILPGSREQEIKRHLPVFLSAASKIEGAETVIGAVGPKSIDTSCPMRVLYDRTYDIMEASDLILTSSGTATLETACFGTPMVVIYKLNWLTYLFIRPIIKVPYIAMVNIVAGQKIIPELIQHRAVPSNVYREAMNILKGNRYEENIKEELKMVRKKLGGPGAAKRAARIICDMIYV